MRILAFPHFGIAYNDSFYAALQAQGVRVETGVWAGGWLARNLRGDDVVHIHWPSFMYTAQGSLRGVASGFLRFVLLFALVRLKTRHIWWTAHNLMPHDRCRFPVVDTWARRWLIRLASVVWVHGEQAEAVLVERFPSARCKCRRIPHGHWIGHYRPDHTRASARRALGIDDGAFVYLFFGQIKPYKNLEGLIRVFKQSAPRDALLLVAGRFSDSAYQARVEAAAGGDPRIRLDARFVPDELVSAYVAASDTLCIPYREILTSGTAMLAMSFGKPVVSINRGFLRDVVTPQSGILIEPGDDGALAQALKDVRDRAWSAQDILAHARQFSFEQAALRCIECAPGLSPAR